MNDERIRRMITRLELNAEGAKLNPLVGNAELLMDAAKMIRMLRRKYREKARVRDYSD